MRSLLFILLLVILAASLTNCKKEDEFPPIRIYSGDVSLLTQDDVDRIGSENYEVVEGDVIIGPIDFTNDEITNLQKLTFLDRIHGSLIIGGNDSLKDLSGLNGLSEVTGGLTIINNASLVNVNELSKLDTLTHLYIENNPLLENIEGLRGLQYVGNYATFRINPSLTTINGLRNLKEIGNILEFHGNSHLESLTGLEQITSLGTLIFTQNRLLRNMDGLQNLEIVRESLLVYNNVFLANIDGLSKVTYAEEIFIYYNPTLSDINGLGGLTQAGSLTISLNGNLRNLEGLQQLKHVQFQLEINTNPVLFNVCGIKPLVDNGLSESKLVMENNGYNPSYQEIKAGNCSN